MGPNNNKGHPMKKTSKKTVNEKPAKKARSVTPVHDGEPIDTGAQLHGEAPEPEAAPEPEPKPAKGKRGATLQHVAANYLSGIEKDCTHATVSSYGNDLAVALSELGPDTLANDLTPETIRSYEVCDRVMLLRSGKKKSAISVSKLRRTLRLALTAHGLAERLYPEPVKA